VDKYHHGNLKAALLKAAFQLVGKIGSEALTLREVARRAGVSHNAPYRHFKSKEDLVAALATEAFRQLHQSLKDAMASNEPMGRLGAAARAYLRFGLANRARFHVMFHSAFDRGSYPEYVAAYRDILSLLSEMMHARDELDPKKIAIGEELIWASIHGITELGIAQRLRYGKVEELEELVDVAVASLLHGLG
jgi:AcrR family transcriptional regulator